MICDSALTLTSPLSLSADSARPFGRNRSDLHRSLFRGGVIVIIERCRRELQARNQMRNLAEKAMMQILLLLSLSAHGMLSQVSSAFSFHTPSTVPLTLQTRHSDATTSLALSTVASSPPETGSSSRTAPSVVVDKFDSYAPTFESHLVDNLKYCAPANVARAASDRIANCNDRGGKLYTSALDAGCGTGLAGPPLRQLV